MHLKISKFQIKPTHKLVSAVTKRADDTATMVTVTSAPAAAAAADAVVNNCSKALNRCCDAQRRRQMASQFITGGNKFPDEL